MRTDWMKRCPYRIHTNLELGLMLRGVKPLAVFTEEFDHSPAVLRRYLRMFDRHVAAGSFVKGEYPIEADSHRFRYLLYALPDEEWRIGRMIRLKTLPGRWTLEREREEGELLGYAQWMNDFWLEQIVEQGARHA